MREQRLKCVTAGRKRRTMRIVLALWLVVCAVASFLFVRYAEGYRAFRPPAREENVISGEPSSEQTKSYQELPVNDGYVVGVDTAPRYENGRLYVNVANKSGNTIWFLVRLYKDDEPIGESGLLYPGETVESIACERALSAGDSVMVKTIAYEPKTYHSEGVAQIVCTVGK